MRTPILTLIAIAVFSPLTGCVSVEHESTPETTTTTSREVSSSPLAPTTTTVERTTTY